MNATVLTGSCTASQYWSSTTSKFNPENAWLVSLFFGNVLTADNGKNEAQSVRAVRGGL